MDENTELILVILGILLLVGLLYLIAFLSFLRKMRSMGKKMVQFSPQGIRSEAMSNIRQCRQCGKVLVDEYGFCPRCGADFGDIIHTSSEGTSKPDS